MAARKGTILSDEHILKECAHYRPIPMKLAARIIDGNSVVAKESPFTNKKLKYQRQMSRPEHFDAYAHSISRNLGNDPEFRSKLHTAYTADVVAHMNPPPAEGPDLNAPPGLFPELDPEIQRLIEEMQGPAVQPVQEQYNNPIQEDLPENVNVNVNVNAIPEEAEASNGDSVPELEPDFVDEVGNVDPNDPRPFGEPSESSEEEGPSPSTAPPPRRSSRAGASRPAGFYSEANQAERGSGAGTSASFDPSHSNFFFQR